LPSYTDLYYHDPASSGSPNLRPEKAWSYDAGLEWNPGPRFRGEVTVFRRRESDGIDYVKPSQADIWRATNIQSLSFTGLEAGMTLREARSQEISLSYTALHGSSRQLAGLLSRYVFNYPSHSAIAAWQAALPDKFVARVRLGVTRRLARDPYAIADIYLARMGRRFRPFVQVTNAWNVSYEEVPQVPMPGRGFVAGVEAVLYGLPN
jgi:outer membrane receptor protein involved in Fe transport